MKPRAFIYYFTAFLFAYVFFSSASAFAAKPILTVAVAANALRPVQEIARAFEKTKGIEVRVVHGSTGKLYAQIIQGAPFDIFLAADRRRPALLIKEGRVKEGESFTYAKGRLVLWTLDSEIELNMEALKDKRVRKIAVANPVTAPYGRAALQAIAEKGLLGKVEAKLVYGESVSQAFSYARTGNAEVAITSLSTIKGQGGRHKLIDDALYSEIVQDGLIINLTGNALSFKNFLFGERATEIFSDYGYKTDGNK
jgi:molybdate transport system substrate-binding protein